MSTALLCTDGSELSFDAIREGLALLRPADRTIVLTIIPGADPSLVTGTGFAGGVMSVEEKDEMMRRRSEDAHRLVADAVRHLGLEGDGVETMVASGDPGREICRLVETLPADVVVIGTHGRSGIKRAVIGSTSDYVVRHAACPVLAQGRVG